MRPALLRSVTPILFALAVYGPAARADVLRIVSSDERGVTLQVSTETWSLSAPGPDGRVHVVGVPDAHSLADPGHALLPVYSTMLALPPDARPTVRVISADAPVVRGGVRLAIARRPTFTPGERGEYQPGSAAVPALTDGAWPSEPTLLGAVGSFRGRRIVGLEVRPFQYDEAAATLRATASLVVRVDFNRPAGSAALPATVSAPDVHADAVLRSAVLNFDQAGPWRVAPAGASRPLFARPGSGQAGSRASFETELEVRVTVDSTGVWLLPYDLLAAGGFPAAVPISQVSVHRHEFLDPTPAPPNAPPYETIEIPIEVEDANHNGVFDSGDRIWMYVRNWAERSGASLYQRWWGDAEVVYATRNPAGGLRMTTREGWRNSAAPTLLSSYPAFQHWEKNIGVIMPIVTAATDTNVDIFQWTSESLDASSPYTLAFTANSIDTTHAVQFTVNWIGRDNNTHTEWAAVKNKSGQLTTIADAATWGGKRPITRNRSSFGSALSEGINSFVGWGMAGANPGQKDIAGMNWFETTYWRRFEAVHDVLAFNSADQAGEIQVHASGFLADSLRVYDVTLPEQPVRLHVDEAHVLRGGSTLSLDLQDLVAPGERRSYVIAAAQDPLDPAFGPRVPAADHVARVTPLALGAKTAGDYVVVVPEAFLSAVQPLVTLRRSLGMQVVVATAEDVYDEFNGGRHSAAALRRFAKYAYDHWNTSFLLLVGDGTLDPKNNGGLAGVDWIPTNPVPGPVGLAGGSEFEVTVSDNLYGCITGNCDPILSNSPVIPELMIGRLPVNSLAEVQAVVGKIVAYEDLSGDQAWRRHLLLSADDAFSTDEYVLNAGSSYCWSGNERNFVGLNQKVRSIVLRDAGLSQMNVENWNLRDYLASEPYSTASGDTCRPDLQATRQRTHAGVMPQLLSHLNSGTLWWNFQGHANEYVLTHEDLYVNQNDAPGSDDKWLFANTGKPLIFSAFSCHANMFARQTGEPYPLGPLGGCIGEDMVTLPGGGAVASWASTCYEVVPSDDSSHINVELARAMFASPPRDPQLWDNGSRVVLGEVVNSAFLHFMSPAVLGNESVRGVAVTYTLLGDPATRVSIGRPQLVVRANGDSVIDGQPVHLRTVTDTLTLVADLVSTARLDSVNLYVNSGGPDTLVSPSQYALDPAFPDTVRGGTYGGRRYRLTYGTHMPAQTRNFVFRVKDRDGLAGMFTARFGLDALLRSSDRPLLDNDEVSPLADLSLQMLSPAPIDPRADVTVTLNGVNLAYTAKAAPGDATGREWILTWPREAPYAKGAYALVITVKGGAGLPRHFRVTTDPGQVMIENLLAFPNPFDDGTVTTLRGTMFSYYLLSSDPADVLISVYTVSGRRIWTSLSHGQTEGYYQVPWDGRDAEGAEIANGIYLYRVRVTTSAGKHADQLGRLVKLRRPRHVDIPTQLTP